MFIFKNSYLLPFLKANVSNVDESVVTTTIGEPVIEIRNSTESTGVPVIPTGE